MKGGEFFQLYYDDLMQSVRERDISPEALGMLIAIMCKQWEIGGPVKPELLSGFAHWDKRMIKRLVGILKAGGHIEVDDQECVSSARMTDEIAKYRAKVEALSAARAAHKAGKLPGSTGDVPDMSQTSVGDLPGKDNKISGNSKTPSGDIDSDSEVEKEDSPLPPNGGAPPPGNFQLGDKPPEPPRRAKRSRSKRQVADQFKALAIELRAIYNGAAEHFGFHQVQAWTDARDAKHVMRVIEIGGKEAYRRALYAIRLDPFLSGQKPARPGESPFVLDFEKLMQTTGNMGDVLARLLDLASRPQDIAPVAGKRWGWWRDEDVSAYTLDIWRGAVRSTGFQTANEWPWWIAGPPLGHKECFVPPEIINEFNLIAKFGEAKHA